MEEKLRYTVWSYISVDENNRPYHRITFFYAGSTIYHGGWMKGSDSFWIVPTKNMWVDA